MGIIRAAVNAIGGGFADQYLEVYEAAPMSDTTVMVMGVRANVKDKRNTNKKGTEDTISNGSTIRVNQNQCMLLVDGGKIVDYTAEEGYYKVDNSSMPSLFNGELGETVKETFKRIAFGGGAPLSQQVYFINMQEIKGIKFGTPNPVNYFDDFYNAELSLRSFGSYSIKITDPLKFFKEAIPRDAVQVDINDINEQYRSEFLGAFSTALNKLSVDGLRVSHVASYNTQLSKHMADTLDNDWNDMRGMEIQSVGIASISYDDESQKLINMRNQGAMLQDPTVREGYVQGSIARGVEAAGSNSAGSMAGFMGVGLGMGAGGNFMGAASQSNQAQMQAQNNQQQAPSQALSPVNNVTAWNCLCGKTDNLGKFCNDCGKPKPLDQGSWQCVSCGHTNQGNFCVECGTKKPSAPKCAKCNWEPQDGQTPKFCPECGTPFA